MFLKPYICLIKYIFKLESSFMWLEHYSPIANADIYGKASTFFIDLILLCQCLIYYRFKKYSLIEMTP